MQILNGEILYQGSKGGSAQTSTPTEAPDDLLSNGKLKMLLAITEGEIQGDLTAQQIFLNDTQLANDTGSFNFTGVKWDYRRGTQDQTYIQGMPEIDNELSVNIEVKQNASWTRQFTNLSIDAVRIKLSLPAQYRYKDNGDMVGTVTEYAIDLSTDGGSFRTVVNGSFDGKTTSEYQRDHRIDLPQATSGWSVRVRRVTADSDSSRLMNAFKVFSYAEIVDSKLRYPNTALLYVEVDASQFSGGAPKVTCRPKGRIVRVPTNYDPVTRSYSGAWQGDFKWAYSNNPCWVFYDLVLDKIFGMGNRVDASMIDKWELYSIAQYCDQKVPDGAGGTEPRFTCNVYIQSQQDAYNVLKDIAAIFRGITFWGNSQVFVKADVPVTEPDWTYTAANVVDGFFNYAGGSYKNRYSSCLVSWSDPTNHYADTVEGVYDADLVKRYDVQEMQLKAIGCTSQSEAHRRGRWALLSNAKDASISFTVGLDGHIPLPASVIGVADPYRAGKQNGGRISAVSGLNITLDRAVDYGAGDRLILNLPDGKSQTRTIRAISDDKKTLTVNTAYSQVPQAGAIWIIDSDSLAVQQFRVTSVSSNDDGTFTISGVQHDPNKFTYIDDGVRIDPAPITVTPIRVMQPPENIVISETSYVEQGLSVAAMQVKWDRADQAINYFAQWRKDNGEWINIGLTGAPGFTVQGVYTGVYDVRVRSINAAEISSPWGFAQSTTINGKVGRPGTPVNLQATDNVVWNIDLKWSFPAGAGDTAYTEIEQATTADTQNPLFLAYVPYPATTYQHGPMPAGVRRWYRARLVDKIGNAGEWTPFVGGMSNASADDLLGDIVEDYMKSPDGQALLEPLLTDPEAIMKDILAGYENVNQQWSQFGENRAGIIQAQMTATDAAKSVAKLETDVVAQFGEQQAAIQEKMTAYADASGGSAIYTMKAGIRYAGVNHDAGLSVAVTINGAQVDTRVAVNANQFVILSGSGNSQYSPFAVVNGQVFISSGFIQDGTITSAKIADASITNAKISGDIQSDGFSSNNGWQISKERNTMTFNSPSTGVFINATGFGYQEGGVVLCKMGQKP